MSEMYSREDMLAREWFFSRPACGELDHGCGSSPPRPCLPCLRDPFHDGPHDACYLPEQAEIRRLFLRAIDERKEPE